MEMLAERYHWDWEEIKKIPQDEMEALLKIISIKNRIEQAEMRKIKKK